MSDELRAKRMAELAADPRRRKYVERMKRGEWWSNSQIDYHEDPRSVATCQHLRSVEQAMRKAGIVPRLIEHFRDGQLVTTRSIFADCRINDVAFCKAFALLACVRYEMGSDPDPQGFENRWAQLSCTACQSSIRLRHPKTEAAWFPAI